jgi:uncharacterized membrane protein HdeD (DUF308 family)
VPRRLQVIGAIYCLIGGSALVAMAVDAVRSGVLHPNVSAFMLPVGLGLLRAMRSSRRWATFWAGLTSAIAGAAALWAVFSRTDVGVDAFGMALRGNAAVAFLLALALLCAAAIWTLYTPPVSFAFKVNRLRMDPQNGSDGPNTRATPVG